jgi:hypothetical protein
MIFVFAEGAPCWAEEAVEDSAMMKMILNFEGWNPERKILFRGLIDGTPRQSCVGRQDIQQFVVSAMGCNCGCNLSRISVQLAAENSVNN